MKKALSPGSLIPPVQELIEKQARAYDLRDEGSSQIAGHIPLVLKWTVFLAEKHPQANKDIAILGALLHDCGYLWDGYKLDVDHAATGEPRARKILANLGADPETIESVARIVRRHRNRDIKPETVEELIVAAADSAAHFSQGVHLAILRDKEKDFGLPPKQIAMEKLERDWKDVQAFLELAEELRNQYEMIKKELQGSN
ncbi:MAG TPA: HD domain-containing protein [Clostridia bacterium]|nr:HD domain-containing protein [Clostridia bacterium]